MLQKILITGGAGYLGSVLSKKLLNKGYYVRILDPLIFGKESINELFNYPNCDIQIGVSDDKYMLKRCLKDIYAVIHLSGLSNDPSCEINSDLTRKANVETTRILLELSKNIGVKRFIYASSCSVYGFNHDLLTEESPLNPLTAYAKSKVDSEKIILPEHNDDFTTVALRKSTLYGPSSRMRFDLVINTMTGIALTDNKIIVNGGEQWRPFLHVSDAADAYIFMLEAPSGKINGEIFNVGSNADNLKILDLAKIISRFLNVDIKQSDSPDRRSYKVSFDKINNLGWYTKKSIQDGVQGVQEMFENGEIIDFRDLNYFNIKRMLSYLNI